MMKITKRQLRRIIKEEKTKLNEGFKELEMEMIEDIIDLLVGAHAIKDDENVWQSAADYLKAAVIPQLEDDYTNDLPDPRPPGQRY